MTQFLHGIAYTDPPPCPITVAPRSVDCLHRSPCHPASLSSARLGVLCGSPGDPRNRRPPTASVHRWLRHQPAAMRLFCTRPASAPTPLAALLHSNILFSGPLTVAEYMRQALTHPTHGYYTTRPHIFGAAGDFVTAPQISPVFSEMLAVWIAHYLFTSRRLQAHPPPAAQPFRLVEFGPGCAALQKALLPALARLNCKPRSLALVDASPALQKTQRDALHSLPSDVVPPLTWHDSADDALTALDDEGGDSGADDDKSASSVPTIFLAHEFFDALPVHMFQRVSAGGGGRQGVILGTPRTASSPLTAHGLDPRGAEQSGWREVMVDADPNDPAGGALRLVLAKGRTPACALLPAVGVRDDETAVEVSAKGLSLARRLAKRVCAESDGGAALVIDYGRMQREGVTMRAIAKHRQQAHFLDRPGEMDLTADVDFGALRDATTDQGATFLGAVTQRHFLLRLGMAQRMRVLAKHIIDTEPDGRTADEKLARLQQDYDRLVGKSESDMGNVYKVAAICGRPIDTLPGFE